MYVSSQYTVLGADILTIAVQRCTSLYICTSHQSLWHSSFANISYWHTKDRCMHDWCRKRLTLFLTIFIVPIRVKTICLEKDSFGIPSEKPSSLLPAGSQACRRNSAVYALRTNEWQELHISVSRCGQLVQPRAAHLSSSKDFIRSSRGHLHRQAHWKCARVLYILRNQTLSGRRVWLHKQHNSTGYKQAV